MGCGFGKSVLAWPIAGGLRDKDPSKKVIIVCLNDALAQTSFWKYAYPGLTGDKPEEWEGKPFLCLTPEQMSRLSDDQLSKSHIAMDESE